MRRLHDAVLGADGSLPHETRLALATGQETPNELKAYADKVARHAYRVTDRDIEALREAGYDDAIFEISVAVALGVGLHRRDLPDSDYWDRVAPGLGFLAGGYAEAASLMR